MQRPIVVVVAHPDDETICSGTILLHRQAGGPVTLVCATLGEMGRRLGTPPLANRETLKDVRELELRAACAILGIGDLRLLGRRDKTLEFLDPGALSAQIGAILAEVRPETVFTFHPGHGVHPDHNAIAAATIQAVAQLPAAERPRVLCRQLGWRTPPETGLPVESVDVSGVRDTRFAALRAHATQDMMGVMQADPKLWKARQRDLDTERFWVYPVDQG